MKYKYTFVFDNSSEVIVYSSNYTNAVAKVESMCRNKLFEGSNWKYYKVLALKRVEELI